MDHRVSELGGTLEISVPISAEKKMRKCFVVERVLALELEHLGSNLNPH